mmetsp:Transcript_2979/g.7458  ORF Transcript_2979/g.7458 Transcript_2979/m.7458 type:complete len:107 (-) Transcript_2979:252-572(-)
MSLATSTRSLARRSLVKGAGARLGQAARPAAAHASRPAPFAGLSRSRTGPPPTTRQAFRGFAAKFQVRTQASESLWTQTAVDIDGNDVSLSKFEGTVALVVNVASK